MDQVRYLLLQIRDESDPIRTQEVGCFAEALLCEPSGIATLDLLTERVTKAHLEQVDAVLIGGSGNYSAAGESKWLDGVLDDLRMLADSGKHTFASCWGFQALARALGGKCIHDPAHAELGSVEMTLTDAGAADPLFGPLGPEFLGLAGHEDHVTELPSEAILLASSNLVAHQAFKLPEKPIYCTQFHPELQLHTYLQRVEAYPRYVESIAGMQVDEFAQQCSDTPAARGLLRRFALLVAADLRSPTKEI